MPTPDPLIDIPELREHLFDHDLVLLDTRGSMTENAIGRKLFETSHIPSAQWVDFMEDIAGPRTEENGRTPLADRKLLAAKLRGWGVRKASRIVVYDTGKLNLAPRVWFTLRWMGIENVRVLTGGFAAWVKAGFELETQTRIKVPGDFEAGVPLERVVTTAEVETMLATHSHVLVDARSIATYTGETTIDTKAGHIRGSISGPNSENFDTSGAWLDCETLRQRFIALGAGHPECIVHTCGSGVAACLNHLAMRVAGLEDAGVYIGSFSEWIRNPNHATATGKEP